MLYPGELAYMLSWDESGGGKRNKGCFGTRGKNLPHKIKKSPAQNLASLIVFFKNMEHMANSKLFSLQHSQNYDLIEWHTPK